MTLRLKERFLTFVVTLFFLLAIPANLAAQLAVHFIDVGQADAILVQSDGENMLVDGGNGADSSLIYAYLKEHGVKRIKYMVNTHPHEDHVGGLPGALNYATVERGFSSYSEYDSEAFRDYRGYLAMQGLELEILEAGMVLSLGSGSVRVLGPLVQDSQVNDNSLVLHLVYGSVSFLLTGDVERDGEYRLLDAGLVPDCTVLKVAHHGSNDSSSYRFLRSAMPEYAVISVGRSNGYGHPTEEVLSRLEDAGTQVFRTDLNGHVVAKSDGTRVEFTVERNAATGTVSTPVSAGKSSVDAVSNAGDESSEPADYIINTSSGKFHLPGCSAVVRMKESNKSQARGSRQQMLDRGYNPCGICRP